MTNNFLPRREAKMLLYWGMFTSGYIIGVMFVLAIFGKKEKED